jgi:hypothetical protein
MPEPNRENLRRSVESLVADRQAIQTKERTLVRGLNRALRRLGYEVVPVAAPGPRRRPRRRRRPQARPQTGAAGRGASAVSRPARPRAKRPTEPAKKK